MKAKTLGKQVTKPQRTPAREKAFAFVKNSLDNKTWQPSERLPSIRSLARHAGVSLVTMFKAIKMLKENGLVSGAGYQRLTAGRLEKTLAPPPEGPFAWQRKGALLKKDIATGMFGIAGKLPPRKELQSRYGICFRTLRKILMTMEKDGTIRPKGKGYVLSGMSPKGFRPQIVFITSLGHYSQVSAINHEHNRIVNMFENECMRFGIQLKIVEIDFYDPVKSRRAVADLPTDNTILGFILDVWWYPEETYQRSYLDTLAQLAKSKTPVAIVDEVGYFSLPAQLESNPLVQAYTIEGKRAGERMGKYLWDLGHKSLAFISVVPYAAWSRDRMDGIAAHYSTVGHPDGVRLFGEIADVVLPGVLTASGLKDAQVKRLIAAGRTPSQAKDLENLWLEWKKNNAQTQKGRAYTNPLLLKNLHELGGLTQLEFEGKFLDTLAIAAIQEAGSRIFSINLEPLFERALADKNISAWVCANDAIALNALAYLRLQGVAVPQDLSVVGFDNIPVKALENHLTSLDFNAMGFVNRMLGFILRPPRPRGPYHHVPIEVEGIVMARDTAGSAARQMRA
jgi:DNA-binding LacI/PurR family transcriptional regulator/DNA-binding transcriptional regulator YhcF (GntR family)